MLNSHTSGYWKFSSIKNQSFMRYFFDEYEEGPIGFPPGCTNIGVIIKPIPGATELYDL